MVKPVVEEVKKLPGVEALKNNPLCRAAQLARRVSPNILAAAAPAPPPAEAPAEAPVEAPAEARVTTTELEVIVEEEAKPSS